MTKRLDGLLWAQRSDETLVQAVLAAAARCKEKRGWEPTIALVHVSRAGVKVEGIEIRPSSYIGSPGLVFVGRET